MATISQYFDKKNHHMYSAAYEKIAQGSYGNKQKMKMLDRIDSLRAKLNSYASVEEQIAFINKRRKSQSACEFDEEVFGIPQDAKFTIKEHLKNLERKERGRNKNLSDEEVSNLVAKKYLGSNGRIANAFYDDSTEYGTSTERIEESAGSINAEEGLASTGEATAGGRSTDEEGVEKNLPEASEDNNRKLGAKERRRLQREGRDANNTKQKLTQKIAQRGKYAMEDIGDGIQEKMENIARKFKQFCKFVQMVWQPVLIIVSLWQFFGILFSMF